ncbi:MAG: hypothetical protein AAF488_18925, partial [Planctomycetota bacterium]
MSSPHDPALDAGSPSPTDPPVNGDQASPAASPAQFGRFPAWLATGVFGAASFISVLLVLVGSTPAANLVYLLFALVLCLACCASWELVLRLTNRPDAGGQPTSSLAWFAFPVAWLTGVGQLPFLGLAVYPEFE